MKNFNLFLEDKQIQEELKQYSRKSDHAVLAFDNFDKIGKDQETLIAAVKQHAKQIDADPHIFVSNIKTEKSPLSAKEKIALLKLNLPETKKLFHASSDQTPSIYHALSDIHKKGYSHATVVLPTDDNSELRKNLYKFNRFFDSDGNGYNFKSLNIMSKHEVNPSEGEIPEKSDKS